MFTFNRSTGATKSIDSGFSDYWYQMGEDGQNKSVVGGMTVAQAYAYVSEIYGATRKISEAIRAYPIELRRSGADGNVIADPAYSSFAADLPENLAYAASCVLLAGAGYWRLLTNAAGRNLEFDPLPIGTVKPVNSNDGTLEGWEYTYGGKQEKLPTDALVYFWIKSLTKRNQPGVSPAMNALGPASQLYAINTLINGYFANGGAPLTVWPIDPATPKDVEQQGQSFLNKRFGGLGKAFSHFLMRVRADMKPYVVGSHLKDTIAPELIKSARQSVAISFSLPVSFLDGENGDQSNQAADYAAAYEFCITPLMALLSDALNEQVLQRIGLELVPLPDKLQVMAQAKLAQMQAVAEITPGQQILTRAEARQIIGYQTEEDAKSDVVTLNGSQVTAALDVLRGMALREVAEGAALPIIMALGIDEKTARDMVTAQAQLQAAQPAPMPTTAPAPMPAQAETEEPELEEEDDIGEYDGEGVAEQIRIALGAWREFELDRAREGKMIGTAGISYSLYSLIPVTVRGEIMKDLAECKSAGDVRAVFERHWPRAVKASFSPPEAVRAAARRGLELREKWGRGGLSTQEAGAQGIGSGVARATNLANGDAVSLQTIRRMVSFFARHEKNKDGKADDGGPSAGAIAWLLWGGDAGRRWAESVSRANETKDIADKLEALTAEIHEARKDLARE